MYFFYYTIYCVVIGWNACRCCLVSFVTVLHGWQLVLSISYPMRCAGSIRHLKSRAVRPIRVPLEEASIATRQTRQFPHECGFNTRWIRVFGPSKTRRPLRPSTIFSLSFFQSGPRRKGWLSTLIFHQLLPRCWWWWGVRDGGMAGGSSWIDAGNPSAITFG